MYAKKMARGAGETATQTRMLRQGRSSTAGRGGKRVGGSDTRAPDAGLLEDHDVPKLFAILQAKRADKFEAANRLKQTLDSMASDPSLFEQKDLMMVATLYRQRAAEVDKIDNNLTAFQHLYDTHLRDLQARVDKRAAALLDIDAEWHTLSGEPTLREYFAQQQVELHTLIKQAKQLLVTSIVENLGPAVYSTEANHL
jgi:hypothetical protein